MLQYREFLQQSRAQRGSKSVPFFVQNIQRPNMHSNQNIKEFVSQPNYGQIFYSNEKNKKGSSLKESLRIERQKNKQLMGYLKNLQQQNMMLKARLNQVLQMLKNQNPNSYSQLNIGSPHNSANYQPRYLTPSIPSQQNLPQVPVEYAGAPKNLSLSTQIGPYSNQNANLPSSQVYRGQYLPNNVNGVFIRNPANVRESLPEIPENQELLLSSNRNYVSQPVQYSTVQNYGPNQTNLLNLARHKLNQIKDNDQQLRQYTIQLLKKPR